MLNSSIAIRVPSLRPLASPRTHVLTGCSPSSSRRLQTLSALASGQSRTQLHRSYLYVPSSSDRMLEKSLTSNSDVIIYDLEDSVPPSPADKNSARDRLAVLMTSKEIPHRPERLAVRLNGISTPFFEDDIAQALSLTSIRTLVLPKVHSALDLHHVSRAIWTVLQRTTARNMQEAPIRLVASIESARSLVNIKEIAGWSTEYGPGLGVKLAALLFAAEDFCADTSIMRTLSRQELLYARSQIAITAKAYGLDAIDMVCVNYKDLDYLKEECEDGRRLGFSGKQAIHPSQVDIIQSTFVPSASEILRAARILHGMEKAHTAQRGAIGLELEGGGKEMIDAPMILQAENVIRVAQAAGLDIPKLD